MLESNDRKIASISINFRKLVTIATVMPALEGEFGGMP